MVDEKMLQDVKKVLFKIDELKKDNKISLLLAEHGVDVSSLDEEGLINAIVIYLLNNKERMYYNQYQMYIKQQGLMELSKLIDSLGSITVRVNELYVERKETTGMIFHVNEIVKKLKMKLHDVPMIRISSLYSHLENDYSRYSKAAIHAGMDESRMSDTIYNIEHGSFILRQMKTKELARLKKELASYKEKASVEIDEKHEKYIRTREEYTELLRSVVTELLRDEMFLNAALLSINELFEETYGVEKDYRGIDRVTKEEMAEVSKVMIVDKFFLYFEEHNQEKYDANTFYKLLEEFILYFYTLTIRRLEGKRSKGLNEIAEAFDKQRELMGDITQYKKTLGNEIVATEDEKDTLSLVYAMQSK